MNAETAPAPPIVLKPMYCGDIIIATIQNNKKVKAIPIVIFKNIFFLPRTDWTHRKI